MQNKTLIIAWREYWSRVGRISFWLSTLAFPVIFLVVSVISGLGSASLENLESLNIEDLEQNVIVRDDSGFINIEEIPEKLIFNNEIEPDEAINQVIAGEIGAFIYYPSDVLETKQISIYTQAAGFIGNDRYNNLANELVRISAVNSVDDENLVSAFNQDFQPIVTTYKDGEVVQLSLFNIIFPFIGLILYMVLVITGSQFMLQSVAEEKENRIIEVMLSTLSSRQLILGKLVGLSGVVVTQVLALTGFTLLVMLAIGSVGAISLPFELSSLGLKITPIILSLISIGIGFLTMSALMIGVAAITPNYRDAQSFAGTFIFLAVTPAMFISFILADPSGLIANILSYLPITGVLTIVLRSAMDAITTPEILLALLLSILYLILFTILSFRLFEIGALQFKDRLKFSQIFKTIFRI